MLPRQFTVESGEKCHPVYIAEIDKVLPQVSVASFNPALKSLQLKSQVSVKMLTKRKWFDLPTTEAIFYGEIMEKLYIEKFSQREFDYFDEVGSSDDASEPGHETEDTTDPLSDDGEDAEAAAKAEVERLKAELQSIQCEDWEDLL